MATVGIDSTPGERLKEFLKTIVPFRANDGSFVNSIDRIFGDNGEFTELSYDSSINYMVRRLITTTKWLKRTIDPAGSNTTTYLRELRSFLKRETEFHESYHSKLVTLLYECEESARKEIGKSVKTRVKDRDGMHCYMCGCTLTDAENMYNSAQVEHVWPHTMGGTNEDTNLKMACRTCNLNKQDFIDHSDFHFEEICIKSDEADQKFSTEMKREYEIAIWAKNNFCCVKCGRSSYTVGKLVLVRRNKNDSWHFLNIDAYCEEHRPV